MEEKDFRQQSRQNKQQRQRGPRGQRDGFYFSRENQDGTKCNLVIGEKLMDGEQRQDLKYLTTSYINLEKDRVTKAREELQKKDPPSKPARLFGSLSTSEESYIISLQALDKNGEGVKTPIFVTIESENGWTKEISENDFPPQPFRKKITTNTKGFAEEVIVNIKPGVKCFVRASVPGTDMTPAIFWLCGAEEDSK